MPSLRRFFITPPTETGGPAPVNPGTRFTLLLVLTGLTGLFSRMVGMYLPLYFKEIGFSGTMTGVYFSVSAIATIIFSLPMGISTDRLSIRWLLAVSFLLVALSRWGLIVSVSFPVVCGFAFFGSFGNRFYNTSVNSFFFKLTGTDNLRQAGHFQAVRMFCMGGGTLLGSLLIARFDFRFAFIFTVAANLSLALLSLTLPASERVSLKLSEYRKAVLQPRVLFVTLVFTLSSLHWGAEMVAYTPFLKENLGLSMARVGLYAGGGFVFVGLGAYLGVVLMERGIVRNLTTVLMLGFVLSGVFHILMCVPHPGWSFFFRMLHEIGDGLVFVVFYHGIARLFKLDRIGGCASFMSLCMGIGSVGSAILFGRLGDVWGYQWPLIISGAVLALLPLLMQANRAHDI